MADGKEDGGDDVPIEVADDEVQEVSKVTQLPPVPVVPELTQAPDEHLPVLHSMFDWQLAPRARQSASTAGSQPTKSAPVSLALSEEQPTTSNHAAAQAALASRRPGLMRSLIGRDIGARAPHGPVTDGSAALAQAE